jgi:diguanylate cyclase (GGDEF)-like protein
MHRDVDRNAGPRLLAPATALIALVAFAIALHVRLGGDRGLLFIDDLGQLAAAFAAAAAAFWAARRSEGRMRRSWIAVCFGAGAWAAGQGVWCYYELIAYRDTPFPSIADAGYLLFPIGAAIGLWAFPSVDGPAARRRWLFDGGIVVTAVVAVSWTTTLGAIAHAGGDDPFAFAVSLAYPIGDILILTMAVSGLLRPTKYRMQLLLLSAAMAAMAVADSSFTYLTATGRYQTGGITDVGWVASFLVLAVAACHSATTSAATKASQLPTAGARPAPATMLPYLPLLLAVAVLALRRFEGHRIDVVEVITMSIALILIFARQFLTVRENRRLLDAVAAREAALHQQAFHDQLTGLANRGLFIDRVQHALELHRRDMRTLAVVFCDLDDFKTVNDTMGHGAGDTLLIRVAERLRGVLRPGDTLARLGGDEFAVLLEDGGEPATVGARIIDALHESFTLSGVQLTVRASVGITELRSESVTLPVDSLLAQADIAMYAAKRAGKGQLAFYEPTMIVPNIDDLQLRQPLAEAIADRVIAVAYQPIVNMSNGQLRGLEALARWTHEQAAISPARFIPIGARAGLLDSLTDHILNEACAQLADWTKKIGNAGLRIGVNVPPSLITDQHFPNRVAQVIDRYGLQPGQLVLEITEDALLDDPQAAKEVTTRLRALGALLSLDDFGRGYSSLLHLQQIPLNSLKIDQGFLTNIDHDPEAERFTAALLRLGRDLGLEVVAEGVERTSQADVLRRLGCPLGQGFLFSRPGTPDQVEPYVLGRLPDYFTACHDGPTHAKQVPHFSPTPL